MLKKPTSKFDLMPPFHFIGEVDWDIKIERILRDYEVPLPTPPTEQQINDCEKRLGFALPNSLKLFLRRFGAVNFDGVRICSVEEIATAQSIWFAEHLKPEQQKQLPDMIQVAEAGADNFYLIEVTTQKCCLGSHDPLGFYEWLPSFDDLIKVALIDLSWGYYGWPDEEIEDMAAQLRNELYGIR